MGSRAIRTTLLALFIPVCGHGQGGAAPSQQPAGTQQGDITIRKNVSLVNVYFSVKDHHGALVPNLSKDSFEVLENGKPQTIKYFSAETDLPATTAAWDRTSRACWNSPSLLLPRCKCPK